MKRSLNNQIARQLLKQKGWRKMSIGRYREIIAEADRCSTLKMLQSRSGSQGAGARRIKSHNSFNANDATYIRRSSRYGGSHHDSGQAMSEYLRSYYSAIRNKKTR